MATKLDKPVTREIAVKDEVGTEGSVNVTLSTTGVTVRGKGTQRELTISFAELAAASSAPDSMPKKYADNKLGWLVDRKPSKVEA